MKSSPKLPVFYVCLLLFAVVLVLFEDFQEEPKEWKRPTGAFHRSPKIQNSLNESIQRAYNVTRGAAGNVTRSAAGITTTISRIEDRKEERGESQLNTSLKHILVWTNGYGSLEMGFGKGRSPFMRARCEVDRCYITGSRSYLPINKYDAIIFHFRSLTKDDLPQERSSHQRWVFWEAESASYIYQNPNKYDGLFNWTMTYRLDSDVQQRYGRVYPVNPNKTSTPPGGEVRNYAEGKTRTAAWFVSNCHTVSGREKVVKYIKKYISVDIYGKCGNYTCPRKTSSKCYSMMGRNYKFYLSFENSLCKDYVTEKFFSVLRYDVVPVVFGSANYTRIAPPHSFINVLDFPSLKSLVKYLQYLDSNDTAYNEYFKWKGHYRVEDDWHNAAANFCDLCKRLHTDRTVKTYTDLKGWFVAQGECLRVNRLV